MKGPLTPDQQLRILARIWGNQRGYVFLPHIDGTARTPEQRRKNYHENRAYRWPADRASILNHLRDHAADDLYFAPAVFNGKRRIEQNLAPERCLWADLDSADPQTFDQDYRPTIAWESSPGRYQGIWLCNGTKTGASWAGNENHRLSLYLGADKSGWDSTQLLRVPGRMNHKPEHSKDPEGVPGALLWDNGPRYVWDDFAELPEVGIADREVELVDDELLMGIDRHEVWSRVKLKVSKLVREYMAARDTTGHDRSDVLWQIERELADAGCSIVEIVAVVRPSVWNKYSGRADELKRLKIEDAKAVSERVDQLEVEDVVERPDGPSWGSAWFHIPTPRPRWIVRDIWTEGSCGFIAGAPKSYKSWMALDLALSVATGLPFLGTYKTIKPGPVLYLQEEDPVSLVKDRYRVILEGKDERWAPDGSVTLREGRPVQTLGSGPQGARKGHYGRLDVIYDPVGRDVMIDMQVQSGFVASDPGWQSWLEDRVAQHKYRLVVVDTLTTTAGEIDTDRAQELMGRMLKPLKVIAQKHNTAICIVHHNRKAGSNDARAGQEMLGSVALHAWVDCALYARSKAGQLVTVDRESKATTDLRFTLNVPRMFEHVRGYDAERQLWVPEITEGDDVGAEQAQAVPGPQRSTAGKRLTDKLRVMGSRWLSTDEINDVMGRNVADQVSAALANGYLERGDDGRVRVIGD